jgi:hypothetical protein
MITTSRTLYYLLKYFIGIEYRAPDFRDHDDLRAETLEQVVEQVKTLICIEPPTCFSTTMENAKNSSKNVSPASFRNLLNVV